MARHRIAEKREMKWWSNPGPSFINLHAYIYEYRNLYFFLCYFALFSLRGSWKYLHVCICVFVCGLFSVTQLVFCPIFPIPVSFNFFFLLFHPIHIHSFICFTLTENSIIIFRVGTVDNDMRSINIISYNIMMIIIRIITIMGREKKIIFIYILYNMSKANSENMATIRYDFFRCCCCCCCYSRPGRYFFCSFSFSFHHRYFSLFVAFVMKHHHHPWYVYNYIVLFYTQSYPYIMIIMNNS